MCNILCHRRVTNHIDIVGDDIIPNYLFFFYRIAITVFNQLISHEVTATLTEKGVGYIERIQSSLGIDFKNLCIGVAKYVFRHIATIYKSRLHCRYPIKQLIILALHANLIGTIKTFVEEAVSTKTITHVHVQHTPWSQNSFFVRVVEVREYLSNALNAFVGMHTIGFTSQLTIPLAGCCKHRGTVAFLKLVEHRFRYPFRHKLKP